jgi:2-haloalkanoic acid dehalogenase type II
MLDPDRFEILTFDCYGTLIDWSRGILEAFQREAERGGTPFDAERILEAHARVERQLQAERYRPYREVLAIVAERVAHALGWPMAPERGRFLPDSVGRWPPFADTNPALRRLRSRYRLGILSNIDDDLWAETRRHLEVDFAFVVTAQQVRSYKPARAHFDEAVRRAGGRDRLLHVAQSLYHDIVPARSLGLPAVWVNRRAETRPGDVPAPDHSVRDLAQLADLLRL